VISCEIVKGDETLLIVCERGYGKRSSVKDFRMTNRGGVGVRSIITSLRNGPVIGAISVDDRDSVLVMSGSGQTLRLSMQDIRVLGRSTQGVRLVHLKDKEDVIVGLQKLEKIEKAVEEK